MIKDLSVIALHFPLTIWRGYVLAVLWSWFISFPGYMPALTTFEAVGILIMVKLATVSFIEEATESKKSLGEKLILQALGPVVFLGFGWMLCLLMKIKVSF